MSNHKFKLVNCDTDSIMVAKPDEDPFTPEEQISLLDELNSIMPDGIKWEEEGLFERVIVLKAKNYILYDGKKIKYKGSAIKATVKEKALQEFIKELLNEMLTKSFNFLDVYDKYVKEIMGLTDITRWCSKKTISIKVMEAKLTQQKQIKNAIEGSEYSVGDKAFFFYKENGNLSLAERFDGDYNKDKLLKKLHSTVDTFCDVIDNSIFLNYSLKKNKKLLEELLRDTK